MPFPASGAMQFENESDSRDTGTQKKSIPMLQSLQLASNPSPDNPKPLPIFDTASHHGRVLAEHSGAAPPVSPSTRWLFGAVFARSVSFKSSLCWPSYTAARQRSLGANDSHLPA